MSRLTACLAVCVTLAVAAWPPSARAADAPAPGSVYPWPDRLLDESMEIGDLRNWRRIETAGEGAVELSRTVRHSGRYAARCKVPVGEGARRARLLGQFTAHPRWAEAKELHLRAYVYLGDDFTVGERGRLTLLAFGGYKPAPDGSYAGHVAQVTVRRREGKTVLCLSGPKGDVFGRTHLPTGKWHCVEFGLTPGERGAATVTLNGREELSARPLAIPKKPDGLAVGIVECDGAGCGGTIFVDDVVVAEKPVGTEDVAVRLAHPSFLPRVGAPLVAILTGRRANDRVESVLTSAAGLSRAVTQYRGPADGRVDFPVDLHDLPASTYTLAVRLLDRAGAERARAEYTWVKPFDGDPEWSIDASNAIVHNGRKVFPVTSFGLPRERIAEWKEKRYCNMLYGMEWRDDLPGVPGYKRLVDAGAKEGMACIGPAHDYRFDRTGKPQWNTDAVAEYLSDLRGHPGVAWWMWREEPINWKYTAASQKSWWDLVQRHDPGRMTEILHMGGSYQIGILRAQIVFQVWPYLAGDIYSWDIYPIENEKERRGTFVDYADVADRAVRWNMGLVPVIPNVATADCTPGKKGGTPTPAEIRFVCWLSIVHGAKGIHWYPYQGEVPPENFAAMTAFVDETTALTEAILGRQPGLTVTDRELGGGRVDVKATAHGDDLYIFAVNLGREPERVTFAIGPRPGFAAPAGRVEVYGENRVVGFDEQGAFTDSFDPIGVHIYRLPGACRRHLR